MKNYWEKLSADELYKLAEFVVVENFKHHQDSTSGNDSRRDVNVIYKEETGYYANSSIFVAKDFEGLLIGSIRLLKWNRTDTLPLQKIFGIDPCQSLDMKNIHNVFHIGRFAVKKDSGDKNLFKVLMLHAIEPVCKNRNNIAFAECDSKLLRIMNLMGIKTTIIGRQIDYLGSETFPIAMDYHGLIEFYSKNKIMISGDQFLSN